jgi:hypothetical protein
LRGFERLALEPGSDERQLDLENRTLLRPRDDLDSTPVTLDDPV